MLIFVLINLLGIVRSKSNNFKNLTDVLSDRTMFQIKGCLRSFSIELQLQHRTRYHAVTLGGSLVDCRL